MTVESILFYLFGSVAVGTALGMILQRNPLLSALLLVANFFCIAALYLLLQAQFLAVIQIVVYTGAIMVLVIFVIMLLNLGDEERMMEKLNLWQSLGLAIIIGFLVEVVYILMFKDRTAGSASLHPDAGILGTVESPAYRTTRPVCFRRLRIWSASGGNRFHGCRWLRVRPGWETDPST